jgi:ATP-dependent RNA helicase DDX35
MAFWQPGAAAPGLTLDRGSGLDKDVAAPVIDRKRLAHLPIQRQRAALPIYSHKRELLYAVETFRVVIVVGETGSGKTTQLPQYLHEAGWTENGMAVCCTQPRRVAAVSVANRVAEEMGVPIGSTVGYAVRFGEKRSRDGSTKLVFCTEGLLLREMMLDPLLSRYSVVILDEAHERTLHTDLLFGLLRKIMQRRPTLRLIVSSATLDAERFREFFDDVHTKEAAVSTIISVQGRQHPVDVLYSMQPVADYLRGAVDTALTIHRHEPPGDILIFMPGGEEVDAVVRVLKSEAPRTVCPLPLYAALPQATQNAVFAPAPSGCRRVIVATAIAETSITFGGVRFVIDPCLARIPFYDTTTGVESLVTIPASKASAAQVRFSLSRWGGVCPPSVKSD